MKKVISLLTSIVIGASVILGGIASYKVDAATSTTDAKQGKKVIVYFPNWGIYNENHQRMEVGQLPWDRLSVINHAFFTVNKNFKLESTDPDADFTKPMEHFDGWDDTNGFFDEYRYYKKLYPDVKLIISVGGWTRGENFSAMAKTKETRKIFIDSCIEFLKKYPFVDGIDIDWEYPGIDRERDPNDQWDRGCPGDPVNDGPNFTSLLKEIREAYNTNGLEEKMLTIANSASPEKLKLQQPKDYIKYLDYINVMTYDIHGAFERTTNHHAALYDNPNDPSSPEIRISTDSAMKMYRDEYGIPSEKLNVGSPFYSRGWGGVDDTTGKDGLFAKATGYVRGSWDDLITQTPGGQYPWFQLKKMENSAGWVKYWDDYAKVPYLYNKSSKQMLTYEDERSLIERCKYVNDNNYGGVIVWEITGDDRAADFPMTSIIYNEIGPKYPADEALKPVLKPDKAVTADSFKLNIEVPKQSRAVSAKIYENGKLIDTLSVNPTATTKTNLSKTISKTYAEYKPSTTYEYRVDLVSAANKATSAKTSVTFTVPVVSAPAVPDISTNVWSGATTYPITMNLWGENATEWRLYEDGILIYTKELKYNNQTMQTDSVTLKDRLNGEYTYYAEAVNPKGVTRSKDFKVTVTQASSNKVPVDIITLAKVAEKYNTIKADSNWNDRCDLNKDGTVDIYDIVMVSKGI
ncbi:glycosyl hydrolase family 18 protein [Clostridium paraputrificum]|uniref:glycosyl hydrolase family 18 protein n=1 Tax=Clostridium TaxID=1485 RepID=UPI003D33F502